MTNRTILVILICLGFSNSYAQEEILLKDYDPVSIYRSQKTEIKKAKFPIIDLHSHPYATTKEEIEQWVHAMDELGIERTTILTYQTGKAFDSIYNIYSKYDGRFELWCGFYFTGYEKEGWSEIAVKELERCYEVGARGVGEIGDKGEGMLYSKPTPAYGMHIDDERMKPLLKRCGELGMPISIHVAEPYWMYEPIDLHNDGLMNAAEWKIDTSKKGLLLHAELIKTLENAVKNSPGTTFIACHYANCSYDFSIIGKLLDSYDNLYLDIAARYAEVTPVPRYTKAFFEKYQDRLMYGTDMGFDPEMYKITFRILETEDEHFYKKSQFGYHWALNGLGLGDTILKKLYHENARKALNH
ncbi:MAG: amidohydrolase [Maribacter sp.]|nr:amidohydrolase [Maribacter sp.]